MGARDGGRLATYTGHDDVGPDRIGMTIAV